MNKWSVPKVCGIFLKQNLEIRQQYRHKINIKKTKKTTKANECFHSTVMTGLSKTKIWVIIHRLVGNFFRGKFPFDEKNIPTCSLLFVLLNIIKQHTHIHVCIMWHTLFYSVDGALNTTTLTLQLMINLNGAIPLFF